VPPLALQMTSQWAQVLPDAIHARCVCSLGCDTTSMHVYGNVFVLIRIPWVHGCFVRRPTVFSGGDGWGGESGTGRGVGNWPRGSAGSRPNSAPVLVRDRNAQLGHSSPSGRR
jgi:hypothetical protein